MVNDLQVSMSECKEERAINSNSNSFWEEVFEKKELSKFKAGEFVSGEKWKCKSHRNIKVNGT